MKRTLIGETPSLVGKKVRLCGWVARKRDHGKMVFLDLLDRSGLVQVVGGDNLGKFGSQDVLEIIGLVKKRPEKLVNPKIDTGNIEIEVKESKLISGAQALPFDLDQQDLKLELSTLLDYRALTLRHPKIKAIFKVQEAIIQSFREKMSQMGFTEFQAPTIVPVATEGGAEVFPIQYFDHRAYLGQSPQLYKQMMVSVFERVFTVTKAYRAEPSVTTRHLTEYTSLDAEMGFIDSWTELMDTTEEMIGFVVEKVGKICRDELALYKKGVPLVLEKKIPRIKLSQALEIILKRTGKDKRGEPDLQPEDEKELCVWSREEYGTDFVFVTHYPTKKRPFYAFPDPESPQETYSFDLIGTGFEWITGGQRINDYQFLLERIKERGNNPADFALYLQAFKYGMPPEGGFALGAERITQGILGLENIREASLFPRDMERIDVRLSMLEKKGKKAR